MFPCGSRTCTGFLFWDPSVSPLFARHYKYRRRHSNAFYFYNDAVTVFSGPLSPGSAATLQNSQCILHGATSTPVSGSGTGLTVTPGMSLQRAYGLGRKNVYLWVTGNAGTGTGWVQTGTWRN